MGTRNIPVDEAGPSAADVMLRGPRTVTPETTVAQARAKFENPRVRLLLVARGDAFVGVVTRDGLPEDADPDATLHALAGGGPGWRRPTPWRTWWSCSTRTTTDRLPVVADDGAILGLVCFNRRHGHFCVDA